MTGKKREIENDGDEKEETDEKRPKIDDTSNEDEKRHEEEDDDEKKPVPSDKEKEEEKEKPKKSGRSPKRQWLTPVGPRHTRIGNSFQATELPSPGSFEASSRDSN